MTGETDTEIPDTGAVFTFGKSKIANNVPSRLWLKNDTPVHISCGQSHSAFVTEQGRLFVFGSNNSGQLGLQTKGPVTKPICVKVLKGERVQFVACGTDHTLVSTSQGEFFASGGNNDGQLGLGHCNDSTSFQRLHPFCDYAPVKLLSAGGHTSAALTEDGRLFLWGDNSVGQLGLGNDSHALLPEELKLGQSIQWVSCGYRHSALVTDNGDVFTFGERADGRLGLSADQLANHTCPQRVEALHGVLQVACGGKHTLALTEDELYSFGRGEFGQLGLGTQMFVTHAPVAVGHFRKGRVTHVACGENHSALITDSGLLYTFGDGRHGKLGFGDENFTNQFSPAVCQRFFDYSVMTVACGSSHMLVFARPRQRDSEEVCLEDEDVTYSYLDRCYTSMLQGQPLEHIAEPAPALVSQLTFIPSSLPTSHRWSLSTRARRRQRESSSAQFGPEFCNLPPLTTGFTALALTGKMLQLRSPRDTPKRFKTDAPVESPSTSITLPAWTPPLTPITKSAENCHSVSMSDKTHEQHTNKMARASSIGKKENVPQQTLPTDVQAGSVSHPSMTESLPPSNLKHKKPRSGDPKNPAMQEECFSAASQSKMQSKTPIQSTNNKLKVQAVEVRSSPKRMSAKEREGCWETLSTNTDSRHKVAKADKNGKVQHTDPRGQEDSTQAEIQNISSPVQEVKQVRTTPTKVQEVKSHEIKDEGIPERATKWAKSPVKVQDVPSGRMEVSVVKSTLQTDPDQKDIKPSIGKAQEVRSTLIDIQQQGNPTSVKIPAKMHSTPKKGNEKNHVDAEENPTPKKAKKKRSDVERALMAETAPKTPSPQSDSIPTRMAKVKKEKPVDAENSNVQLRTEILEHVKRDNDSKTPQNSNISFPPIENRKSGGAAEISQSTSNLQSEHKHSQSSTDKVLTEQKYDFPSIKSLTPERGHSFSKLWSNNESATSKSSATKETESSSGYLLSPSPQHRQSPIKEIKLKSKSVEPEEPNRTPQPEQSIMGSVVSLLPAMAIASAAPLLIKAAEVLSETSPEQSNDMSLCASVSQEIAGNNILPEQEVDQDSTVQDVSAIEEIDDSSTKKQSAQHVQTKVVLDENGKMEEVEDVVRDSETERVEERGEEESLAEEEDESEGVGQKEAVEDEERESNNNEDGDSVQKGEEDGEEEEGEEEESEGVGQKEAVEDEERESNNNEDADSVQKGEEDGEEEEGEEEESEGVGQKEAVEDEERESNNNEDGDSVQKGEEDGEEEEGEEEESEGVGQKEAVEDEERESNNNEDADSVQKGEEDGEEEEGEEEESEGVGQKEAVEDEERESNNNEDGDSVQKGEEDGEEEEGEEEESEGVGQKEAVEDEERESNNNEDGDSVQKGEEDGEEEEGEEEESEAAGEEDDYSNSRQSSKSEGEKNEGEEGRDETEREEEESEGQEKEEDEDGEMEENKDEESGGEDEEKESESWDEGSKGEVEDDEKTDAEEEQEGESSDEEKMEVGEQSDSEDENKNVTSDEEEGESEERDVSEEEENETGEEEGELEEKGDEESQEEDEVGYEDEEENQDEETDHEEEEENRDQEEEEEEENEEDKEEEVDKEDNNEELKYKKDGVTSGEEEEGEESVREEERQNEVEAEDEENISDKDADEDKERQEGSEQIEEEDEDKDEGEKEREMDTSEVKFRGKENLSETLEENRGDEDDEVNKPNEMMEENEEDSGSEKEEEEEETDKKEENKKPDISGRKQIETNEEEEEDGEEEEEETEQKENSIKSEINRKQKESSEEEEYEESEEEEEEEEEAEQKEMNIKMEKNRMKQRETSEEEEQEEESEEEEEEEEEAEQKEMNIKTEKNRMKQRETSEEEEQEEESEEEEVEEEAEWEDMNIKTEKNRIKQKETSEEEEQEEEGDDEEEEETEKKDKIGRKQTETTEEEDEEEEEEEEEEEQEEGEEEESEEEEEEEEEEEKTKKAEKQRAKPNLLPARRQTIAQRDRQQTRERDQQNVKGKKQTDSGAQDPQFWNSVLPQYLNLK